LDYRTGQGGYIQPFDRTGGVYTDLYIDALNIYNQLQGGTFYIQSGAISFDNGSIFSDGAGVLTAYDMLALNNVWATSTFFITAAAGLPKAP